jgi:hypothetical protein
MVCVTTGWEKVLKLSFSFSSRESILALILCVFRGFIFGALDGTMLNSADVQLPPQISKSSKATTIPSFLRKQNTAILLLLEKEPFSPLASWQAKG